MMISHAVTDTPDHLRNRLEASEAKVRLLLQINQALQDQIEALVLDLAIKDKQRNGT